MVFQIFDVLPEFYLAFETPVTDLRSFAIFLTILTSSAASLYEVKPSVLCQVFKKLQNTPHISCNIDFIQLLRQAVRYSVKFSTNIQ